MFICSPGDLFSLKWGFFTFIHVLTSVYLRLPWLDTQNLWVYVFSWARGVMAFIIAKKEDAKCLILILMITFGLYFLVWDYRCILLYAGLRSLSVLSKMATGPLWLSIPQRLFRALGNEKPRYSLPSQCRRPKLGMDKNYKIFRKAKWESTMH